MWLKTAPPSGEVEQLERPETGETLTEISSIRWDRQGHHPVREEVRRSAARAVEEIAAFQIAGPKQRPGSGATGRSPTGNGRRGGLRRVTAPRAGSGPLPRP